MLSQLTFVRFLAATAVVIFHFGLDAWPFKDGLSHRFGEQGGLAVSFFFMLSGFILFVVYNSKPLVPRSFFVARFARIYPVYLAGIVLALGSAVLTGGGWPKGYSIILQLLGLHAWFPGLALEINFPGWSVSVELFFYLLFPVLLLLAKRSGMRKFILIALFIWMVSIVQCVWTTSAFSGAWHWPAAQFLFYFPPWHLNTFIMGIAAGMIYNNMAGKNYGAKPMLVVLLSLVLLVLVLMTENPVRPFVNTGMLAPLFGLFILGLALDRTVVSKILSHRLLQFLGESSYAVYLLQFPIWIWFEQLCMANGINAEDTVPFYIYLAALVLVSGLTYRFFEKPVRRKIRVALDPRGI